MSTYDHAQAATRHLETSYDDDLVTPEMTKPLEVARAQVEATRAVAAELRTANLLTLNAQLGHEVEMLNDKAATPGTAMMRAIVAGIRILSERREAVAREIAERLGIQS